MYYKNWFLKVAAAMGFAVVAVFGAEDITNKFTDENFKKAVYQIIGKTSGSTIYDSDIDTINILELYNISIKSLAGIERFTALTKLYCYGNQLTTLDVSKNTALTYLGCTNNQLTTLDVSKNTALTQLFCNGNQLTELDVSKNTALTWLYCSDNQLTTLDVSNNTALTELDVPLNYFTGEDKIIGLNKSITTLFRFGTQNDPSNLTNSIKNMTVKKEIAISFAGIKNGEINLNLKEGNYTAELYNLQGRLINRTEISATNGVSVAGIKTDNLSKGMLILNVKQAGVSVLKQKIKI
jgi:hypothetical protein